MSIIDRASKISVIEDDFNITKLIKFVSESCKRINKEGHNRAQYYNNIHRRLIKSHFSCNKYYR